MKVLYDYKIFMAQRFGGISKCFCELISHRPKGMEYEIAVRKCNNVHLLESGLVSGLESASLDRAIFHKKMHDIKWCGGIYSLLLCLPFFRCAERENIECLEEAFRRGNFDVFHSTTITWRSFYKRLRGKPFVYTVHDMTQERLPRFFGEHPDCTDVKRELCGRASAVVAVSENTKRDLMEIIGVPERKICVVPHGGPAPVKITSPAIVDGPYFLYVGQRYSYKNFMKTLDDFHIFHERHKEVRLVCTAGDFTEEEEEAICNYGLTGSVLHRKANDTELRNLYTYAVAFVFPSLYEGFGMPTLEAFAQGCPCLLNDNSCMREIGGDAAYYFKSDGERSDLPEVMETVYGLSSGERATAVARGYARLGEYSWERSAARLFSLYKSLL